MANEAEDDDDYVTRGKNAFNKDDPYVIHDKNLIAEVSVTAHSDLVSFFTHDGLSVSSEHAVEADTVRIRVSGRPKAVEESISRFQEENPEVSLHILEAVDEDRGEDSHSS